MKRTNIGVVYCTSFIVLEAFQAVYLGSVFQNINSFLIGAWVFGISAFGAVGVIAILRPIELKISLRCVRLVVALNLLTALTWITYFIAVQIIEPAIVFTLFSGMVHLGTVSASIFGAKNTINLRGDISHIGNTLILVSILALSVTTIMGLSGFVRGGLNVAVLGIVLSGVSGSCMAAVIWFSARLNTQGVGPLAQFGLRFILYTILTVVAYLLGIDDKGIEIPALEIARVVVIGLAVIAFPLYLIQKAVPLLPVTSIAAMTSLGPAMVFAMQLFEGRVGYSVSTLLGLSAYVFGAALATWVTIHQNETVGH